jgi:ATP-dependent RNA helicase RhlE
MLKHLLRNEQWGQVLVFARTKYGSDKLARQLSKAGVKSDSIHGDKKQSARTRALQQFKSGQVQVLVATDIAARGIDIQQLPLVVNFELPHVPEDYVHRIGRTGRAGEEGVAVSLVSAEEAAQLQKIERLIKQSLPRHEIEGFEPEHRLPTKEVASPGKRRPRNKAKSKTRAKPASRNQSKPGKPDRKKSPKATGATQRPRGAQ